MNLYKKTYVKNWEHMSEDEKVKVEVSGNEKKIKDIDTSRISHIVEEVAYWRKANAIHKYFVDECNGGIDDCKDFEVSQEELKVLLDKCERIIAECPLVEGKVKNGSHGTPEGWIDNIEEGKVMTNTELAEELLPTESGFFFGGTDYDQYYMQDIIFTRDMLKKELEQDNWGDYYYSASW